MHGLYVVRDVSQTRRLLGVISTEVSVGRFLGVEVPSRTLHRDQFVERPGIDGRSDNRVDLDSG